MDKKSVKLISAIAAAVLLMVSTACAQPVQTTRTTQATQLEQTDQAGANQVESISTKASAAKDSWAIYWYLCGSDLESNGGCATDDLLEMTEAALPSNVTVVVQTGGANVWNNNIVDEKYLERYVYKGSELELVDQKPRANMGKEGTLQDFLSFCEKNYPADKKMVLFWNHGAGSVGGVAFDEQYGYDSLTLQEMQSAFKAVYPLSAQNPPFELVGFDACLMATVDTADAFSDIAQYMVASQEMEPGTGWHYTGWLEALAKNPSMGGEALGKAICDSYAKAGKEIGNFDYSTLSVVNLKKIAPLLSAYDNLGNEALIAACADPGFFGGLGRSAIASENYGGNTDSEGYSNMVDLGDLAKNSSGILPKNAQAVIRAMSDCVTYKVNGPYRKGATGLSCFYSYDGDSDSLGEFKTIASSKAFKYLYEYEQDGKLSAEGKKYVSTIGVTQVPQAVAKVSATEYEDFPVKVNDDGNAVLTLGAKKADKLKAVYFQLCYFDIEDDVILMLGKDNNLDSDWGKGVFKDNFGGYWGTIDGRIVYMEITYEGDGYNLYSVPVLLNGEEYNLRVAYDYDKEAYEILGARKGLEESGMASKELRKLTPGDELTTLHYAMTISGDDDELVQVPIDKFKVTKNTKFEDQDLGDGEFVFMFEMVDMNNESWLSQPVQFSVEGDSIYTAEL